MRKSPSLLLLALSILGPGGLARAQSVTKLTVEQAVQEAFRVNDQLRAAQMRADAADDSSRSARGNLLPALSGTEQWQHFNAPFTINVSGQPGQSILARNINANTLTVSANQPLLGLVHLGFSLASANHSADASRSDAQSVAASLGEQVRTTYLRLFEALAQQSIAQASVEQLQQQVKDAEARYSAGTITNADLLRFRTAAANAQQQFIQAKTDALVDRQGLLTYLARNPEDTSIDFVEPEDLERLAADPVPQPVDTLINQSIAQRPEVAKAQAQALAAQDNGKAQYAALLPELNLQGAYQWTKGQLFFPENEAFIGFLVNWPFWTWGAQYYAAKSAERQADAAEALSQDSRRQAAYDVSSRYAQLQAQFVAVQVAQTAIASAEEAYRVTDAQVRAGIGTTTDLLDAQSALTTARLNLARAQYERAVARVALDRATGATPSPRAN
ncbi:MAG: TolC family protein [Myxococcaceae bacterium]